MNNFASWKVCGGVLGAVLLLSLFSICTDASHGRMAFEEGRRWLTKANQETTAILSYKYATTALAYFSLLSESEWIAAASKRQQQALSYILTKYPKLQGRIKNS